MAEMIDSCCVSSPMTVQLTKPDKNNNTTANMDDGLILPSEQCDTTEDGIDKKSDSTADHDDRRLSSGADDDGNLNSANNPTERTTIISTSLSNDDSEIPIVNNNNTNPTNTSTNHLQPSDPYKDFSGVDTESFIATTLRNNPKDRALLLMLETILQQFIQDDVQSSHQFQAMNSYERMIVHRVAAFFGLDHNVDKNGQAVVVTKTPNTRMPDFSFQKCIPEDESIDPITGSSTTDNTNLSASNAIEIPTRRILRRHEKSSNHDHAGRHYNNDDHSNSQSSNNKHQPLSKPYSERVSHYAETRARIFNEASNNNMDSSNASMTNKSNKTNSKPNPNSSRISYRKQNSNSSYQNRSYSYPQSQSANANTHLQQYATGKTIDPSSHVLNASTTRSGPMYPSHQVQTSNLNIAQGPIYASMVTANPGTGSIRQPVASPFYTQQQQQSIDYDFKQQIGGGGTVYNYVSMIPPTATNFVHPQQQQPQQPPPQQAQNPSLHPQALATATNKNPNQVPSQHAAGMPLPIIVHQPSGQIQYLFPAQHLQPQQQQQQPLQHAPPTGNPYSMTPDGQYFQMYRPDTISIAGAQQIAANSVMDSTNSHHHAHHHAYPPSGPYHHHHHQHPHSISQQVPPSQQQQQQVSSSQSNPPPPAPPFVRIYATGGSANVSHPFAQASFPPNGPAPGTYVQAGTIPPGSFMIPPQTPGSVQTYPTFDNGVPYQTYGPPPTTAATAAALANGPGKSNMNNNNGASVQYATNHLSTLTLQNSHDDYQSRLINNPATRFNHANGSNSNHQPRNFMGRPLVQSPNGSSNAPRMTVYSTSNQSYRPSRPYNLANTDKSAPSAENDPKSLSSIQAQQQQQQQQTPNTMSNSSETIALVNPAQE